MEKKEEKGQTREGEKKSPVIRLKGISLCVIVVVLVVFLALFPILMSNTNAVSEPTRATLTTFWVYFCLGTAGGSIYLSVLLITEKNIKLLRNDVIEDIYLMTTLFLLSGGLVAAAVQTSTGIFSYNSIYAVLLLGFGWRAQFQE